MVDLIKATPKKIIICCDGTFQNSTTGQHTLPSNITRLCRTIAKAGKDADGTIWQQVVFYDAGIGTTSGDGTDVLSKVESIVEGAVGQGLVRNVLEAYNFIVNNYSPGDKIYCFGFSRGAYTARAIAGMVTDFGVIRPDKMSYFTPLFAAYQKNTAKNTFRKTKEYFEYYYGKTVLVPESQKNTKEVALPWFEMGAKYSDVEYPNSRQVEVVGVFDTVGSLGLGDTRLMNNAASRKANEWLNVGWNPYIKHAFHAIGLDERRQPFLPTLFYIPNDEIILAEKKEMEKDEVDLPELTAHRKQMDLEMEQQKQKYKPDLKQVWFTGVHINVGGGATDSTVDYEGLANMTFAWMVEQVRPYLAFEDFTNILIANYLKRTAEDDMEDKIRKQEHPTGIVNKITSTFWADLAATKNWLASFVSTPAAAASKEKLVRAANVRGVPPPVAVTNHWAVFRSSDSYGLVYKLLLGPVVRSPGASDDRSAESHRLLSTLGKTNEWVHPSVRWRTTVSATDKDIGYKYTSEALKGFEYVKMQDPLSPNSPAVWSWYKKAGNIWLPEWPIVAVIDEKTASQTGALNSELALVDQCQDKEDVRAFLTEHAAAWGVA